MKKNIIGIKIIKKKVISDHRGKIMHMMRSDDSYFKRFGEIYFSQVFPKKIKAWHLHKKMTLNYVAVFGKIKLVLYDDRRKSKTKGKIQEIFLSEKEHKLVIIPPFIWNGFCSAGKGKAIIANCSDIPHDKNEIIRLPHNDKSFPYNWKINK
ncbi:dTDP-4-dehydrorhamnose 3,5-epimerase family protein [Candidatus Pelagibacter bacterium]|nr:dTDP-4-dehydrorhamnose 3,5-epimerase family protein [Candidatus Pelagibacter bacterium]|tara:strand:- start:6189 stop:6644 length:456 start_codon:yes stop_codon:yes gene_type:complete